MKIHSTLVLSISLEKQMRLSIQHSGRGNHSISESLPTEGGGASEVGCLEFFKEQEQVIRAQYHLKSS